MSEAANVITRPSGPAVKDLYEVGEIPPLGHVPAKMHAWAIRRERHGEPEQAMQLEVVPNPVDRPGRGAGPRDGGGRQLQRRLGRARQADLAVRRPQAAAYHIAGSDASGIVWAVGAKVKRWKVGDEVVVHCNQDDGDDEECNGGDPMFSTVPAHLGLRDAGRLLRPVLPGAGPPADARGRST